MQLCGSTVAITGADMLGSCLAFAFYHFATLSQTGWTVFFPSALCQPICSER